MIKSIFRKFRYAARDFPMQPLANPDFGNAPYCSGQFKIPLNCIQTWETNSFGRTHCRSLLDFRQKNSAFKHYLYDSEQRDAFMEEFWNSTRILEVYRSARHGVTRADIFRYCYIYKRGGFYSDIAKVPPSPLLSFLYCNPKLVVFTEASGASQPFFVSSTNYFSELGVLNAISPVYNSFFGASAFHKALEFTIDYICRLTVFFSGYSFSVPRQAILALTGPAAFNYGVQKYIEMYGSKDLLFVPIVNPSSIVLRGSEARFRNAKSYMDVSDEVVIF